jgi:uncharacterized protein (DUF1778 family)
MTQAATQPTPPTENEARLHVRLAAKDKALIEAAAEADGLTLSAFVVQSALEKARVVIGQDTVIRLSLQAQQRLAEAVLYPQTDTLALRRAFAATSAFERGEHEQ